MQNQLGQFRHKLGQTGIELSPVGLGTVKFGRNQQVKYPSPFDLPEEDTLAEFLDLAYSLGINTLDTAPAYGLSEERLGRLLQGQREKWTIIGKAGEDFQDGRSIFDFSPDGIERSIMQSLQRLNTDIIDILLIHSDGNDVDILQDDALATRLADLKSQKMIKAHGMYTKTAQGGMMALDRFDCVMATYHPGYTDEKCVLERARDLGKGILLKKALASGHIDTLQKEGSDQDPVELSLYHAYSQKSVSSVIIGTISQNHLRHNVEAAVKALDTLTHLQREESPGS